MTEKYNIESFLIAYTSDSGYILYTYDNDEYEVTLETIGTRTVEPMSEESPGMYPSYFRELASSNTFYQSFYIEGDSGEIVGDRRRIQLEGLETYVKEVNEDETSITCDDKAIDGSIDASNGEVYVEWPINEQGLITIQLSYISSVPLVSGQNYIVEINGETINSYHGNWECKEREGFLYLGDYNTFMEGSDESIDPPSGIVVELQQVQGRNDLFYSDINYYIDYSEESTIRYRLDIIGNILIEISDVKPSKKITIDNINYFYVGNLYLFTEEESDNTEEEYLILSTEVLEDDTDVEINVSSSKLYVATSESETVELLIDLDILTEIKALEGATLLSFGREVPDEHNSLNNYGIAINSSDDFLALPQRAISLFETQIRPNESIKVDYRFRGILGTLPELPTSDVSSIYSTYMEGTQGIYTDNMYLGNAGQYIAFYTDGNDDKHLRISTKELIYELGTGQGGSDITWEDYIDEKIGEVSSNQHFWFSATSTSSYVLTKDTEVDSEKTYYVRSGSAGNYTYTVVTPEEGDNPLEEGWYEAVLIPAGAYITDIDIDLFKEDPANNANIVTRNDGVYLKKGLDTLAAFEHSGLRFYNPVTLEKSIELNSNGLALYKPLAPGEQNQLTAAQLTANGLNFYGTSISTPDVTLNADGLTLINGSIRGGIVGQDEFLYLSPQVFADEYSDYVLTEDIQVNGSKTYYTRSGEEGSYVYTAVVNPDLSINPHTSNYYEFPGNGTIPIDSYVKNNWRQIIGRKFAVDTDGNLYANNANIEGAITATSLTIGSGSDAYDGTAAINISGYDIEIEKNGIDEVEGVSVYLYPILYHNGERVPDTEIDYTHFVWYQDDSTTGTEGSATDGSYLATYGHNYRVVYDFDDGAVGSGTEIQTRTVDPSKYITKINDYGITIHPEVWTNESSYIQLDGNGMELFNSSGNSIAQYGSTARVGLNNSSRFLMNNNSLEAYDSSNNKYFEVSSTGIKYGNNISVASQTDVNNAAATATNYISTIDDGGIKIHSNNDNNEQNILMNTDGFSIRNGLLPMMTLDNDSLDFNVINTLSSTYTNVDGIGTPDTT